MNGRNFRDLIERKWGQGKFVCVGLDSDYEQIPESIKRKFNTKSKNSRGTGQTISAFNKAIINATWDLICAFKINIAFYEAWGIEGLRALIRTIDYIKFAAPGIPIILDAKRGDIGNTNNGYVRMAFEILKVDAITVNPYLGAEALKPFLERKDKGIFVLCRTSNPGAGEFQDLGSETSISDHVAYQVSKYWNTNSNCGLVVGARQPHELQVIRLIVGDMPILIPGIGAQGGDVQKTVQAGIDSRHQGMIINSSRGIIFASREKNFADVARDMTKVVHDEINLYR